MSLHTLPKIIRKKKRRGRGIGSRGAKSGRGMKGQRSRAGYSSKAGFEGGQTPLYMRLPKNRGAKQKFPSQVEKPTAIRVSAVNRYESDKIIGPAAFIKEGLLASKKHRVKLIGKDEVRIKATVRVHAVTAGAKKAIEDAGGKVEIIAS